MPIPQYYFDHGYAYEKFCSKIFKKYKDFLREIGNNIVLVHNLSIQFVEMKGTVDEAAALAHPLSFPCRIGAILSLRFTLRILNQLEPATYNKLNEKQRRPEETS